jgi:O-antigen/teichoic acid export membrane protein
VSGFILDPHRWKRNSIFILLNQFLGLIITILMAPLIARHLGPDSYGMMNWVIAYVTFFQVSTTIGSAQIGIREIARNPDESSDLMIHLFLLNIFCGLIGYLSAIGVSIFVGYSAYQLQLVLLWGLCLLLLPLGNLGLFLSASLQSERLLWPSIISNIFLILAYFAALRTNGNVQSFLLASLGFQLLLQILTIFVGRKYLHPIKKFDWAKLKMFFWESLPLNVMTLLMSMVNRVDIILLERFSNSHDVGLYSAAGRVVQAFTYLPQAVAASVLPALSVIGKDKDSGSFQAYKESRQILLSFGLFLPVMAVFRGDFIIKLLFGEAYQGSIVLFQVLSFTIPMICVGILPSNLLTAQGKQWQNLKFTAVAAILSTGGNLLLIPYLGPIGAAITSNAVYFVLVSLQVRAGLILLPQSSTFLKDFSIALPALCITGLLFFFTRDWPAIPVLILTTVVYLTILRIGGVPLSFARSTAFSEQ